MRGPDRIHAGACHRAHVRHAADDVRCDSLIDVETDFVPMGRLEIGGQAFAPRHAAAHVEQSARRWLGRWRRRVAVVVISHAGIDQVKLPRRGTRLRGGSARPPKA